jgi:hypothetical protein
MPRGSLLRTLQISTGSVIHFGFATKWNPPLSKKLHAFERPEQVYSFVLTSPVVSKCIRGAVAVAS